MGMNHLLCGASRHELCPQTVNNVKKICASFATGFIVGGVSAGANLAAAVVHRARDDPFFENHKITGHILQIPALLHPSAYPAELVFCGSDSIKP